MFSPIIIFLSVVHILLIKCEDDPLITFYDFKTKNTLLPPITTIVPSSENSTLNMTNLVNFIRLPFIGQPCECKFKFMKH